jgi:hypothetical protein
MEQKWIIDGYTVVDECGLQTIGKLHDHKITILNEETQDAITFNIELVGLFDELLQTIVYLYEFESNHEYFNIFIESGYSSGELYQRTVEQSNKIRNFISTRWIDGIKLYLKMVK